MNTTLNVEKMIFGFSFFILYIFSGIFHTYLKASSDWSGLAFGMIFFIMLFPFIDKYHNISIIKKEYISIVFIFLLLVAIQYFMSSMIFIRMDVYRMILTYLSFGFMLIVSAFFANMTSMIKDVIFNKVIIYAYTLLICIGILSIFLIKIGIVKHKEMILFSEPSHFAIIYLPILLYVSYFSKPIFRIFHILIGFIIALLIKDLTLLFGIVLILTILYWYSFFIFAPLALTLLIISNLGNPIDNYFLERLRIVSHSNNLSVLVFISGWERAFISILSSYGFGLGFEQLGHVTPKMVLQITNLNGFGGGCNAAKITAELGITGVVIVIIYLFYFLKIYFKLVNRKINKPKFVFFSSIFFMYSIDLFVRGTGYFNAATFMFMTSVYLIYFKYKQIDLIY